MKLRTIVMLMLALVFGGSAAVGVSGLRKQAPAAPLPDTTPVVVAAEDVGRGNLVTAAAVKTYDWPKALVPPGALTRVDDALDRVAFGSLAKGEPVLEGKLAPRGAGRGLAAMVPTGKRAVTIQATSPATGLAGLALPGNRVDVLLTMTGGAANGDPAGGGSTSTLLQNVEILAVDQRVDAPSDNKVDASQLRSVTLLVTPDQAAKLELGQSKGTLHLALRNLEDDQAGDRKPATMSDLGQPVEKPREEPKAVASPPPPPPPEPPAPLRIRTLRGSHQGAVYVQPPGTEPSGR